MLETLGSLAAVCGIVDTLGVVNGRVRIQKAVYFMKVLGAKELSNVTFKYNEYGPSANAVYSAILTLIQEDLLVEDRQDTSDEWQCFRYETRDAKMGVLAEVLSLESTQILDRVIDAIRDEHWRTLELAASLHFLKASGIDNPIRNALGQKPGNRAYAIEAQALLRRLGLNFEEAPSVVLPETSGTACR